MFVFNKLAKLSLESCNSMWQILDLPLITNIAKSQLIDLSEIYLIPVYLQDAFHDEA